MLPTRQLWLFSEQRHAGKTADRARRGGYRNDTPAAIVYKASWPDEMVIRCTVGTLAENAAKYGINKTALITVGGFLGNAYDRSELYNPTFAHGFREADPTKLDVKPEVK